MPVISDKGKTQTGSIRVARRAAGLSQEQLARLANCSTAYIRLVESGYAPGHSEAIPRILRALSLPAPPAQPQEAFATYRRALGLTQRELGRRAGLAETIVADIESGYLEPNRTEREALSAVLQTAPDQLFPPSNESSPPVRASSTESTSAGGRDDGWTA